MISPRGASARGAICSPATLGIFGGRHSADRRSTFVGISSPPSLEVAARECVLVMVTVVVVILLVVLLDLVLILLVVLVVFVVVVTVLVAEPHSLFVPKPCRHFET